MSCLGVPFFTSKAPLNQDEKGLPPKPMYYSFISTPYRGGCDVNFTPYRYSLPDVSQSLDLARQVFESIYRTRITNSGEEPLSSLSRAKKGHPPNPCILLSISNRSSIAAMSTSPHNNSNLSLKSSLDLSSNFSSVHS